MKKGVVSILIVWILLFANDTYAQSRLEKWKNDIDVMVSALIRYHPMLYKNISEKEFSRKTAYLKEHIIQWQDEKIIVEMMKVVSSICDGHTEILLYNQKMFDKWFPVRIEYFRDGIFITGTDSANINLLGAKVLNIGSMEAEKAYKLVGEIVAKDDKRSIYNNVTNYISNAVLLKNLGIIRNKNKMDLKLLQTCNKTVDVELKSSQLRMGGNWKWNKTQVPVKGKSESLYNSKNIKELLYLKNIIPARIPYWYEYIKNDRMLYFQYNAVTNWDKDPFSPFIKKMFDCYDTNKTEIDYFIVDLRLNEGGNGALLPELVVEFANRKEDFKKCKLYIATGLNTFSAAPNLIGQLLKYTNAMTIGEIAPGPLNWCSDVIPFNLPFSNLKIKISTMSWQTGHATDIRGYYPPDYFIPCKYADLEAGKDPVLEAIKKNNIVTLKEVLLKDGWEAFYTEYVSRIKLFGDPTVWFPYTSFDLIKIAYFDLYSNNRSKEAISLLEFNVKIYPDDWRAMYYLAEVFKDNGNYENAFELCKTLMKTEPNFYSVIENYISSTFYVTYKRNGINELFKVFKSLRKKYPNIDYESILNNIGYKMLNSSNHDNAVDVFSFSTRIFPKSVNAYNNLGEAYLKVGNKIKAKENFQKSIELNPNNERVKKILKELK